ncbi:MAG: SEC-C metal-binding domain-containing protein [bacterium]
MASIFSKIFDSNEKQITKYMKKIQPVNELEESISKMSFEEMRKRVSEMRSELKPIMDRLSDSDLDSIHTIKDRKNMNKVELELKDKLFEFLPEMFAFVREVAKRKFNRRHFDVQLIGGYVLSEGKISELKTGEGKTQVAWLPLALYALTGRGAHLVTVNDYLARSHGEYAGHIFSELGLTVGITEPNSSYLFVQDSDLEKIKGKEVLEERQKIKIENPGDTRGHNLIKATKKEAYKADILYATNNEIGFDYLRDNMAVETADKVQRELFFCIVDEVDSILIDEARTPLIISAPAEASNELYFKFAKLVEKLEEKTDYTLDEKSRSVSLTDQGAEKMEKLLDVKNIWENYSLAHHMENALKARVLFKNGDEYLVRNGEVMIVDEFTGRILPGRRYSEGLHQAIEAKEGVEIKNESKTLATITFQNLFRVYKHLSGMTGTAETEAEEFFKIYSLDVVVIITNRPVQRKDLTDIVYKNQNAKFRAVVEDIKEKHSKSQPVLVGTTSVEKSEILSKMLGDIGIEHEVLNAKYHEKEATIISKAGRKNAVTIATNMAGRGTDIKLDQNVNELGGLHVIGTERHEARRIDNQLRGRSGRQGDNGSTRFYVALDDEIMKLQGGMIVQNLMSAVNIDENLPIEATIIGRTIENAQKRVEGQNFDIRKSLVDYDDVMNMQREIFYARRRNILFSSEKADLEKDPKSGEIDETAKLAREDLRSQISEIMNIHIETLVDEHFFIEREDKADKSKLIDAFIDISDDVSIVKAIERIKAKGSKYLVDIEIPLGKENLIKLLSDSVEKHDKEELKEFFNEIAQELLLMKEEELGEAKLLIISKAVMLQTMDELWTEHLEAMQDLREGIGLRGYAQRDPLVEYKNEAFGVFDRFIQAVDRQVASRILKVREIKVESLLNEQPTFTNEEQVNKTLEQGTLNVETQNQNDNNGQDNSKQGFNNLVKPVEKDKTNPYSEMGLGRNDPCPCGSGKKYKKCHGKNS